MIDYEENCLRNTDGIIPGCELYFNIDFANESAKAKYGRINNTVVTVKSVEFGGIEIDECFRGIHFSPKCFHRIISDGGLLDHDFDAVFL